MHRTAVKKVVLEGVLDANDALAQANRQRFDDAGNFVVNMMSSPGAGKTALLEHTLDRTLGKLRIGVLEGDVQTTLDADRLARFHAPSCRSTPTRASAASATSTRTWSAPASPSSRCATSTCSS
jgi:hypothetical protein